MNAIPSQRNLIKLVNQLNDGSWHTETMLARALKMSRTTICDLINQLIHYGVRLECEGEKGYRLSPPLYLLDAQLLTAAIQQPISLQIFESITSTNDYLKSISHTSLPIVCLAECQTAGRGRFQRAWHSPFAQNIYLSLSYRLDCEITQLAGFSLVISLVIAKMLKHLYPTQPIQVKWPNDIMIHHHKLSGSLIELQTETPGSYRVIIGIGINVNMIDDTQEVISQSWTSLKTLTGENINRNLLVATLINQLFDALQHFQSEGLAYFMGDWKAFDGLYNQPVSLNSPHGLRHGIMKGIDQQGQLLLETNHGIEAFSAGDTSLARKHEPFKSSE